MENQTDYSFVYKISVVKPYVIAYIILFCFSAVLGVIGNLLILIAGCANQVLRDIRYAFIFNLAFADLAVTGVTMPMSIIGVLMGRQWFDDYEVLCKLSAVVCAPGCVASTYSICLIAISKYFYICQYSTYLKFFTKSRIVSYVMSIWLVSFGVHVPNHFGWGMVQYSRDYQFCTFDSEHLFYSRFYAFWFAVAIVITAVFYVKMHLVLRSSILPRQLLIGRRRISTVILSRTKPNQMNASMSVSDELRLMKASFMIFMLFLIFWMPATVLILMCQGDRVPEWAYLYAALAAHSNSTLNVFIYYFNNHAFRRGLKAIFTGRQVKVKRNVSVDCLSFCRIDRLSIACPMESSKL